MQFFSGFSLKNEQHFFDRFLKKSDYTIAGFSYGAIDALQASLDTLGRGKRLDTLQLFSPAFFQTKEQKFKRLQMMAYKKDKDAYMQAFIKACFAPYDVQRIEQRTTCIEELEELLYYEWSAESLKKLQKHGVHIEVYLGFEDKIIDAAAAKAFFIAYATITSIKKANHFLQEN